MPLCKWWNGHGSFDAYYTYQTSAANPRFFDVMRNPITTEADRKKMVVNALERPRGEALMIAANLVSG